VALTLSVALLIFFTELFIKNFLKSFPPKNFPFIHIVFNKGIAFGLFKEYSHFLNYLIIIFILFLLYMIKKDAYKTFSSKIAYGLILGGAFSNLYDRLVYGYVIDYIDLKIWPVFNLADSTITVGVVVLLLKLAKEKHEKNLQSWER